MLLWIFTTIPVRCKGAPKHLPQSRTRPHAARNRTSDDDTVTTLMSFSGDLGKQAKRFIHARRALAARQIVSGKQEIVGDR